ncbi:MAG: hypothetical protein B6226_02035 [Candidatus Cloacimonetes bacterium 4572_65]|nr:MAG: hypothetical protein B6226_02035 [Candidatus Cloacimonetes bacterium 4572_65]
MSKRVEFLVKHLKSFYSEEFLETLPEDELLKLADQVIPKDSRPELYHRTLDEVERRAVSTEAYGYLLSLLTIKSITTEIFEKTLLLCVHLYYVSRKEISKKKLDKVVTMVTFSDVDGSSPKEILDLLLDDTQIIDNSEKIEH